MGSEDLSQLFARAVMVLVPMILSLTIHEFAHAWSAKKLGDDTAEKMGRLNLNPLSHIDPIGTIVLPIILLLSNVNIFFGWAKPVPVNPTRFSRNVNVRTGMLLVSAAGPISNIIMAILCTGILAIGFYGGWILSMPMANELLQRMMIINIALAVFNMIPVYPLDGQKVLSGLLPAESAVAYDRFNYQYGWMLLLVVIFLGRHIIGLPIFVIHTMLLKIFGLA